MKSFQKMVVGLLMVLGLSSSVYAEVRNYFINGVGNTFIEAEKSRDAIQKLANVGNIQVLYNTTEGAAIDFIEAGKMMINLDNFYTENGINHAYLLKDLVRDYLETNSLFQMTYPIVDKISIKYALLKKDNREKEYLDDIVDLLEDNGLFSEITFANKYSIAVDEVFEYQNLLDINVYRRVLFAFGEYRFNNEIKLIPSSLDLVDLNTMYSSLNISDGVKYNFISHSQGNLFANRLLALMVVNGVPKENVRLLSVATPDSFVFGDGKYINLKEDLVADSFVGLSKNYSNYIQDVWDILDPDSTLTGSEKYGDLLAKKIWVAKFNLEAYGDVTGHGFIESYLRDSSDSKEWIIKEYSSNYLELKALDYAENLRENVWLNQPTLSKTTIEQGEIIQMSMVQGYSSNKVPENRQSQVCYRITTQQSWSNSYKVKSDVYSYSTFTSMQDGENESVSLLVPESINPGNYYFGMKADCNNQIMEVIEDDNYEYIAITVAEKANQGDVYITSEDLSLSEVVAGGEVKTTSKQRYSGSVSNADLPNPKLGYYLSKDSKFSSDDELLDYDYSSIGYDDSYDSESETLTIPADTEVGIYYILFVADYTHRIEESDETNNVEYERIEIVEDSGSSSNSDDFYPTNARVSDSTVYRGQEIKAYVSVNYSGSTRDADMSSVYTSYYITCGNGVEYLDYDLSSLGSDDRVHNESEYIIIPESCSTGAGYIIPWVDIRDGSTRFEESDENNNIALIPISIRWLVLLNQGNFSLVFLFS